MVLVTSHISGYRKTWSFPNVSNINEVYHHLKTKEGSISQVVLHLNSKPLDTVEDIPHNANITATLRLPGGKGGFGSMLRAIGAQIEKTTNREACRDLSGRRLRDINEEKRLKDFISKKAEKEREALEKKKKRFEELQSTPKHLFQDDAYYEQKETREKDLHDAMDKVFSKDEVEATSSKSVKRSSEESSSKNIKKQRRFFDDLDESSDESDEEPVTADVMGTKQLTKVM